MKLYNKKTIYRGDNIPYLIRYSIPWLTTPWFAVKVHNILISDDACLHDHPWAFISMILWGKYEEERKIEKPSAMFPGETRLYKIKKSYRAGNILYRPAKSTHRLELTKPMWTLVITFKKVRQWGFYTPRGFVGWRDYHQNKEGRCE